MSDYAHLAAIFVLVLVSVVAPVLAVRVRIPAAVVLIVVGFVIGPAGLGLVTDTPPVALLAELGFLVLMFVAGMEIDFEALRQAGARGLAPIVLSVLTFFGVAGVLGIVFRLSVLELLVVSASSVGMPLAMLQETGQLPRPLGRFVLLTASLGEFVSILAVVGYEVLAEPAPLFDRVFRVSKVLLLFVVAASLIRWARAVVWWWPAPLRRLTRHHDVSELGVRAGLLVMFAFVLIAATLGVEPILGAFLAGALVAFVLRERAALESKIAALGQGLFIPIFFVVIGVRFDPRVLDFPAIRATALLVAMVAAVKIVPVLACAPRELGLRDRLAAGSLLAAPLTLLVAIAAIGARLHAITPVQESSFLLLAIVLSIGFPIVFRLLVGSSPDAHARAEAKE